VENRVAELRNKKGFSQEHFAKLIGISRPYLSEIERGKAKNVGGNLMIRIARELGIQVEDIFFDQSVCYTLQLNRAIIR
jgi:putative transcriptional regulator